MTIDRHGGPAGCGDRGGGRPRRPGGGGHRGHRGQGGVPGPGGGRRPAGAARQGGHHQRLRRWPGRATSRPSCGRHGRPSPTAAGGRSSCARRRRSRTAPAARWPACSRRCSTCRAGTAFRLALDTVLASGQRGRPDRPRRPQPGPGADGRPRSSPSWRPTVGGVLFGVDPVSGRRDHAGRVGQRGRARRPSSSGEVDGTRYVLSRRGA